MGYILDLRKTVGHRIILITGSCVLLLNEADQLLLQKRSDNGLWSLPGGSMEPGETFEECARREVQEETGLNCLELEYYRHFAGEEMFIAYPNGDEAYIASLAFVSRRYEGEMKVQEEEASEQHFFSFDEIPADLDPITAVVLKDYLKTRAQ